MKKTIKYFIIILIFLSLPTFSQEVIKGGVELDWPLLNQQEREKAVEHYHDILFNDVKYKIDKEQFKSEKKDPERKHNVNALRNNFRKLPDRELAGFYFLNKILFIYGVEYKDDKYHVYYYNMLGHLEFIDILDKPYDVYPHISYQYRNNGKLEGAAYYISEYDQYMFDKKGKFKGRWYGEKMYDKKAKIIMTRKLP